MADGLNRLRQAGFRAKSCADFPHLIQQGFRTAIRVRWLRIAAEVEGRASSRCEYCRMHQSLQGATFHVEHVFPTARGGRTELANLAWACPGCNLMKSDRTEITDPVTGSVVRRFDPRRDNWFEQFTWKEFRIIALTPIVRAMIAAFDLNHSRRQIPDKHPQSSHRKVLRTSPHAAPVTPHLQRIFTAVLFSVVCCQQLLRSDGLFC